MPVFYVETSALLKRYLQEAGTDTIDQLFAGKLDSETLITSYFAVIEAISVATRMFRSGTLTIRTYGTLLAQVEKDLADSVSVQSVSDVVVSEAITQTRTFGLRAPDAIHLATALQSKSTADVPVYFVCSDARLNAAAEASGLLVIDPEATDAVENLKRHRAAG